MYTEIILPYKYPVKSARAGERTFLKETINKNGFYGWLFFKEQHVRRIVKKALDDNSSIDVLYSHEKTLREKDRFIKCLDSRNNYCVKNVWIYNGAICRVGSGYTSLRTLANFISLDLDSICTFFNITRDVECFDLLLVGSGITYLNTLLK